MPHKRALIATLVAGVFAITAGAVVITRAAGGGSSPPPACPPHPRDAACVFLGMPTEYISRLPAAKQTDAARILQDYENAVKTPHPHDTVPRAWLTPGTATPTPLVAGPGVRPCQAADLHAAWIPAPAPMSETFAVGVGLSNTSAAPCGLSVPRVQLIGAAGRAVLALPTPASRPCPARPGSCIFPQPLLMLPSAGDLQATGPLHPGQAGLAIYWRSIGRYGGVCSAPLTAAVLRLVLPAGGGNLDMSTATAPLFPRGITVCHGEAGIFAFTGQP